MDMIKKYRMSDFSPKEPKKIRLPPLKQWDYEERAQKELKK